MPAKKTEPKTCRTCRGERYVRVPDLTVSGEPAFVRCPDCNPR